MGRTAKVTLQRVYIEERGELLWPFLQTMYYGPPCGHNNSQTCHMQGRLTPSQDPQSLIQSCHQAWPSLLLWLMSRNKRVPFSTAPQLHFLHPETWELKRQVICPKPQYLMMRLEKELQRIFLFKWKGLEILSGHWFLSSLEIQMGIYCWFPLLKHRKLIYLFIFSDSILCEWMFCLHLCLWITHVPGAQVGQMTSDTLGLVVSHHGSAGNQTWILWKSSRCS